MVLLVEGEGEEEVEEMVDDIGDSPSTIQEMLTPRTEGDDMAIFAVDDLVSEFSTIEEDLTKNYGHSPPSSSSSDLSDWRTYSGSLLIDSTVSSGWRETIAFECLEPAFRAPARYMLTVVAMFFQCLSVNEFIVRIYCVAFFVVMNATLLLPFLSPAMVTRSLLSQNLVDENSGGEMKVPVDHTPKACST